MVHYESEKRPRKYLKLEKNDNMDKCPLCTGLDPACRESCGQDPAQDIK